ncbi:winged helix-turn-helix transcriptional regulator [Paenibacillus pinisoli]|uniref:Winged helix-turn-helix transcriptional regulator n=1 Tax=Paenibacillus pinisoli TaxID=1276110 RepID=A0A3A6PGI6_9BACL|nr:LuxR C-terminal-related transcriptional regulator [Paenibacillus pinisoli]RJX40035.1 winged helix-turn-helix transcriptional regulator [Paenibacillus pinisoli]
MSSSDNMLKEYGFRGSMDLPDFIRLAVVLTEMVGREHQQTSVIGNLDPDHIKIVSGGREARLIGSGESHAAYRSPEQSGRLNGVPDVRSDLYALGVILYEQLSGRLPLEPDWDGDWESAHIYKAPLPVSEIRPEWAGQLDAILMKLLAKSPEQRYQGAYGLLDDWKQCLAMLENDGVLASFELGRYDQARSFRWPSQLYGRDADLEMMESELKQAAQGEQIFRWITGPEGSGKTALAHSIREMAVLQGGRFVEGGFLRGQESAPLEPIVNALNEWLLQLWSEPPNIVEGLKSKLLSNFSSEAGTLTAMLPGMRMIFGETAGKGTLPNAEDMKRFTERVPDLIRCLAASLPPLVLFIDNMDCADRGTLDIIKALAKGAAASGLLFIGAFRTEESSVNNAEGMTAFYSSEVFASRLALQPLSYEDVRHYVSHALHEESSRLRLLASSLFYQTSGNPRQMELLLSNWLQEGKLSFHESRQRWTWDSGWMPSTGAGLNRDLMKENFGILPDEEKSLLAMAAAIGGAFHLALLAEACNCTPESAACMLRKAEAAGMVGREDDEGEESTYLFLHEYVREMAYGYDPEGNANRHLTIGRLLQQRYERSGEMSFAAVDQLNMGAGAMALWERRQLPVLNLEAGQSALADAQYASAKRYAQAGLIHAEDEQLPQTGSVYVQLRLAAAWSEYMGGNPQHGRDIVLDLKSRDQRLSRAERIQIWTPLIQFHAIVENDTAVEYVKEALEAYGWKYREGTSKLAVMKEVVQTQSAMYRKRHSLPLLSLHKDDEYLSLCMLMERCFLPLLMHNAEAQIELYARFIRYGISRGMNGPLAMLIASYNLLMHRVLPGYAQVVPALDLERITAADPSRLHRIFFISGMARQLESPQEASHLLFKAMRRSVEYGDKEFANIAMITCLIGYYGSLYELEDLLEFFSEHVGPSANDKTIEIVQIAKDYLAALQNESLMAEYVKMPQYAEEASEEDNYSCLCKLEVAFLSGHYRDALYWARRSRESELAEDWARVRKQRVFEALTLAALYPDASAEESKRIRKALHAQLRRMRKWKGHLGQGSSAYLLLKAECERLAGREQKALRYYIDAVKQSRSDKYGLMEGIICERLALCYKQDLISSGGAMIAMLDAGTAYSNWGVTSKVTQIRSEHAHLLGVAPKLYEVGAKRSLEENQTDFVQLHMPRKEGSNDDTKVPAGEDKLLQQLLHGFGQLAKGQWVTKLLHTALRQSGADRGRVLRDDQLSFAVAAELGMPHSEEGDLFADSVLRHTRATKGPVVVHDAIRSYWIRDNYIASLKPRSILCMPFSVPGEPSGFFLYLENQHVPGVFTERDLKVLELIATRIIYIHLIEGDLPGTETIEGTVEVQEGLVEPLTKRELEILTAISEGMSNKDIADQLGITETTVKTHVSRIFGKMGVKRRGQAVVRANELGLLRK